jgi:hypothetical protein
MAGLMSLESFHPQRRRWLKLGSLAVLGIAEGRHFGSSFDLRECKIHSSRTR